MTSHDTSSGATNLPTPLWRIARKRNSTRVLAQRRVGFPAGSMRFRPIALARAYRSLPERNPHRHDRHIDAPFLQSAPRAWRALFHLLNLSLPKDLRELAPSRVMRRGFGCGWHFDEFGAAFGSYRGELGLDSLPTSAGILQLGWAWGAFQPRRDAGRKLVRRGHSEGLERPVRLLTRKSGSCGTHIAICRDVSRRTEPRRKSFCRWASRKNRAIPENLSLSFRCLGTPHAPSGRSKRV